MKLIRWIVIVFVVLAGLILVVSVLLPLESIVRVPSIEENHLQMELFKQYDIKNVTSVDYKSVKKRVPKFLCIIETRFPPAEKLEAKLYLVNSGKEKLISATFGYDPQLDEYSELIQKKLSLSLVLYDFDLTFAGVEDKTRISAVKTFGASVDASAFGDRYKPFKYETEKFFSGKMQFDQEYLVYVCGDKEFKTSREMSITEFAKKNPGNYLVVIVKMVSQ